MTPLALRLLLHVRPTDGALAGDLAEQYASRQSSLWLWRQVIAAILVRQQTTFATPRGVRPSPSPLLSS